MSDQSNKNQNSAPKTTSEGTPSDDSSRDLWCLIEGDALVRVTVAANKPIAVLKELVYAKGKTSVFGGIDAKDLVLLKVSDILESGSSIYVRFVRLIYLSLGSVPQIFGNFKSPETQCLSTRAGVTSLISGRFNPLIWFTSL